MALTTFPEEGAQARRKADGLIGEVYAADPSKDLLTVRWSARPGLNTLVCTSEQFARDWELTGKKSSSPKKFIKPFVAVSVFMAVCCFVLVKGCDSNPASSGSSLPQDNGNSSATGSDKSSTGLSAASNTSPTSYPELHFVSAGRLPTKLHIFRLGMSVAEAMAEDPDLKNQHGDSGSGSQPPTSDPDAQLEQGSERTDFYETASFSNGRLTYISSTVSNISPEDASLFNRSILVQLGKPDVEIYAGSSANAWVWIDGDVRIKYTNNPGGNPAGARSVDLSMVIYPDLIKRILAERSKPGRDTTQWDEDANLEFTKHYYGDDASPVIRKQLPTGLPDVRLRMTPWQIRSALPGIELIRMSTDQQQGELKAQDVSTDVALWDGLVSFVGRTWEKVSADQVVTLRRNLMEEFGTPSERILPVMNQFESITWEDEHTKIVYMFSVMATDKSHQIQAFYYDKRMSALSDAANAAEHPSEQFKPAPEGHTFF